MWHEHGMRRRFGPLITTLLALAGISPAAPATDVGRSAAVDTLLHALQRRSISLDEAVAMVQDRYNAKVVKAETVEQRGHLVHRIRLLSADGRVWTVNVDAASGAMR